MKIHLAGNIKIKSFSKPRFINSYLFTHNQLQLQNTRTVFAFLKPLIKRTEAEFKEFVRRLKFKLRLSYIVGFTYNCIQCFKI